jgi:penicillin-binding protein-related factor A (putative recombinase)
VTEAELKKEVRAYLDSRGIHHTNNFQAARNNYSPRRGISDLTLCYRGRYVAIELKATGKKATKEQLEYLEEVYASGGTGGVFDNMEDIKTKLWALDQIIDS